MEYLIVLDYTNNTLDVEPCPVFDNEDEDNLKNYLLNKYGKCDVHYMVGSNININI